YNWMVRKYDATGNLLWSDMFNGTANGGDGAYAVVVDLSGSVYVAGTTTTAGQSGNWMIRKYSSGGAIQWTINYNGAASGNDSAFGIGLDGAGNLLVTGDETVAGQGLNWLVRRYAPDGTLLNSYAYNSPANVDDSPRGMAVTSSGAFAVGGYETRTDLGQGLNWLVRMYSGGAGLAAELAVSPGSVDLGTPATV